MIINAKDTDYEASANAVRLLTEGRGFKAHVITFGCQQNEADSEKIRGMAISLGYALTDTPQDADLIIMNTCAIRAHAEMKALSMLGNFKAIKKANPSLIVGVVGCMAAEKGIQERLKKDFHYVTFTLEPNTLHKLPSALLRALSDSRRTFVLGEDKGDIVEGIPVYRMDKSRAWVSVMYGCNNFCSYCIVPYVRGRERSRASKAVLSECRMLVASGIKEITLLGQNVNSYKSDMNFAELLECVANIEGDFIIRFMTSHPKDASDALIDVMRRYKGKIAPYFHLPLQAGSDSVLKAMNRTYDSARYLEVAGKLRSAIPDIALSTDVIIGFPGETDEDFEKTLKILETVRFDNVYSFLYSPREGTRAAKMTPAVPDAVKNERMKRLLEMQDAISLERNLPYVGNRYRVLVEDVSKKGGNTYSARTASGKLVHFTSENNRVGEFIEVEIEKAGAYDLYAKEI